MPMLTVLCALGVRGRLIYAVNGLGGYVHFRCAMVHMAA